MAAAADTPRYESSAGELSSPPSGSLSEPGSPSRLTAGRPGSNNVSRTMDQGEIVVGNGDQRQPSSSQSQSRQITFQQYQQPSPTAVTGNGTSSGVSASRTQSQKRYELIDGQWVQLTAAGIPRKKPGRKPGTIVKPKTTPDGAPEPPKARKPRKPRDPNAPPVQRKRKLAPASDIDTDGDAPRPAAAPASGSHMTTTSAAPTSVPSQHQAQDNHQQQRERQPPAEQQHRSSPKMPKREGYPGSMQSILNADPPVQASATTTAASTSVPVRSSGLSYDPIRGNYDPVRETITAHGTSQFSSTSGSPRGPTQLAHRSPSIASMLEPQAPTATSPTQSHHQGHRGASTQSRLHAKESPSMPPSPSYRPASNATPTPRQTAQDAKKESAQDAKKETPPPPPPPAPRPVVNQARFTTIANGPVRKTDKSHTGVSTPKTDNLDDVGQESESRSILDFGKARPGEELLAPTIILKIPIKNGETNKYVNFTRLAEERYGWDALHPRLAANRDRKARIAAAAASLEKVDSGRESGDEMSVDLSDGEASNPENGGTSGPDAQAKPKKKRNFKEDQYDVDDDFVDDSEMLWEAQAAASRDGFFVYSGPLVPEVERPPPGQDGPPKRGRGSRGGRGGRGAARGGATGRGGGPGSRGGTVGRKPRITKSEKLQREREKADRESAAQLSKTPTNAYALQPTTPSFTVSEIGA
ncbi:HPC2 and ubinuclein domain-containing protein [Hirsutella rhossiliensis]|uniref:HPC2 and ubinuclein domain-containing protein n=1 Tax=Hirsutella rhossiliensis TaxID=111463 RepID=A0A9P8MN40_9HYPO|nr:HPC2 and ubinuclein domain-containing protein [Hirsutella rhossiliensis]KAH0958012.1 HPC2 and ubinuclein domain-containing protein [Hirsutella rhossiliensis]